MSRFDDLYEAAADNYGIITTVQARKMGVLNKDLTRYVKNGRLLRLGHGVYQVKYHVPEPNDIYAECVALVGPGAYLFGESVIAMHSLAPTNPSRVFVATSKRVRKNLPNNIRVVNRSTVDDVTFYEGIPSQSIVAAILSCKSTMMPERLIQAANKARHSGLIKETDKANLLKEIGQT